MTYHCLIIDDEPLARRIIEKHLSNFDQIKIIAKCGNAFDAMSFLQQEQIDILFLDINMPKLSGINFLKSLRQPPLVIFTTAYPEYAVEGFELEAIDYLLKPISLERFTKAIFKAIQQLEIQQQLIPKPSQEYLIVKADKKLHKIEQKDILYMEAYGDYVKIKLENRQFTPKKKLSDLYKEMNQNLFLQVHRSFIINLKAVEYIEGNRLKVGEKMLPISQTYRNELLNRWTV